jgi:hypothetical protein
MSVNDAELIAAFRFYKEADALEHEGLISIDPDDNSITAEQPNDDRVIAFQAKPLPPVALVRRAALLDEAIQMTVDATVPSRPKVATAARQFADNILTLTDDEVDAAIEYLSGGMVTKH